MATAKFIKVASGGLFGAGIGTALALLYAPQSGDELRARTTNLWQRAKLAGIEAQAATEQAMIARYRQRLGDEHALESVENDARERRESSLRQLLADAQPPVTGPVVAITSRSATPARTAPVAPSPGTERPGAESPDTLVTTPGLPTTTAGPSA